MTKRQAQKVALWVVWSTAGLVVIGLLLGLLIWGIVSTQRASDRRDAQIAALVQTVSRNDRTAAADRATAAANQKALLDYTAALAARQDALLAYLRAHGIHLPERLVTVVPKPRIVGHRHRVHHVRRHRSGHRSMSGGRRKHRHH